MATSAKDSVLAFINALNNNDFETARKYTSDDLKFIGVLGSREGAVVYFHDMERMRLKYDIKKAFEDGNDVCLLYDVVISGLHIFGCGWYQLENDKINMIRVVFDPRPVLEQAH